MSVTHKCSRYGAWSFPQRSETRIHALEDTLKALYSTIAVCCLLALAPRAQATPVSYNLIIGSVGAGSVSGTITTDGTSGFLAASNIIDWNIMLNPNPGAPFDLLGPLSGNNSGLGISGSGLF